MWRTCRSDASKPSMVRGQLGVRVLGAQTEAADSPAAHTVYRTAVNYRGVCHHRLIRFRDFLAFAAKVKVLDGAPVSVPFPPKLWTRKASLQPEVVEARRVLIDEFMQQVCAKELAPRTEERLLRLLQLAHHARQSLPDARPSKGSSDPGERRTLDVARESADASLAIMSLPTREDEYEPAAVVPATAVRYQSVVAEMEDEDEDEDEDPDQDPDQDQNALESETQQSSGELAGEADARASYEDARARRSASLPVLPLTPVRCAPRPALRASETAVPPAHLRKMVDFSDSPEADAAYGGGGYGGGYGGAYTDSGVSSASSTPSPANKYEDAVLARRKRIGELLQASARLSSAVEGA